MSRLTLCVALAAASLLVACERPRPDSVQTGYRGTGMVQVTNPRISEDKAAANVVPEPQGEVPQDGPKANTIYKNVQVLGNLSVAEFNREMLAITQWVAPQQGCNYCHNPQNLADDSLYTKVVARRMIQMTRHLNVDWKVHVQNTGVTCYTCHRGNNIPANVWFSSPKPDPEAASGVLPLRQVAYPNVGLASLPDDPLTPYLLGNEDIRIGALKGPDGKLPPMLHAEHTYGLMIHMSQALGQNCTFCHNSRNFGTWENSNPQRLTAYHGIRMARDLNTQYMVGLTQSFPAERLGPTGDVAKVNCATCHQGVNKPLYGASMLKDYPALAIIADAPAPAAAAAPAASEPGK